MVDALQLLRDDHKRVKELFSQFEAAEDTRTRGEIVRKALLELDIHAEVEEEIFYPAVRKESDTEKDLMDEAEEEHHVVKLLIAELRRLKPGADRFDAKFTVLAENVKHHIDEEESEMLPRAAELGMQRMNELGAEMEQRKLKLQKAAGAKASKSPRRTTRSTPKARPAGRARSTAKRTTARTTAKRTATRTRPAAKRTTTRTGTPAKRRSAASATAAPRASAARKASAPRAQARRRATAKKS